MIAKKTGNYTYERNWRHKFLSSDPLSGIQRAACSENLTALDVSVSNSGIRSKFIMSSVARGWESKSVEAQQEEANEKTQPARPRLTEQEAARVREVESLRLARLNVTRQLAASSNPQHRKLMEAALAELEAKLRRLGQRCENPPATTDV